ncbi:MAG TPA: gamma carbonic anhydrase family protein [Acidobacteriota bacterium]|nr:gamma carbonic anhydrase family protein [Acidobacteriota bacterium]
MIREFLGVSPRFDESNFIAPSAEVIGDVALGRGASVWFNATLRGDVNWIRIGEASNVQDNAVVHVTNGRAPTLIGKGVTIGHSAVIHGCTIEDNVLVGIGSVVLDHAVIGRDSIVGARALLTSRVEIPPRSLVLGAPARVARQLSDDEVEDIRRHARNYQHYSAIYLGRQKPDGNPFYKPRGD